MTELDLGPVAERVVQIRYNSIPENIHGAALKSWIRKRLKDGGFDVSESARINWRLVYSSITGDMLEVFQNCIRESEE